MLTKQSKMQSQVTLILALSKAGSEQLHIIYEIRKDVGLGKRLKKGDMLSFFVIDIENLK